jgi:hypothetical protein
MKFHSWVRHLCLLAFNDLGQFSTNLPSLVCQFSMNLPAFACQFSTNLPSFLCQFSTNLPAFVCQWNWPVLNIFSKWPAFQTCDTKKYNRFMSCFKTLIGSAHSQRYGEGKMQKSVFSKKKNWSHHSISCFQVFSTLSIKWN